MSGGEVLLRIESIQDLLVTYCTGGTADEDHYKQLADQYKQLRRELLGVQDVRPLLTQFVLDCSDLEQFWAFIKPRFAHYSERRQFIWEQLAPLERYVPVTRPVG